MEKSKMPFIKWTGSKRKQAPYIVDRFPNRIETYYEGFVGGASVLHELLNRIYEGDIMCKSIVCSDLNRDLIMIWQMLVDKEKRTKLYDFYCSMYYELLKRSKYVSGPFTEEHVRNCQTLYYEKRDEYNNWIKNNEYSEERAMTFYWLTRTAFNGLIRYNNKTGFFNASFHVGGRLGISPDELKEVFDSWTNVIDSFVDKGGRIEFVCDSYENVISGASDGDVVYLDPPYDRVVGTYFCKPFSVEQMNEVIERISENGAKVLLSFDGTSGDEDRTSESISHWYVRHEYVDSGQSSFKKLKSNSTKEKKNKDIVKDSLYINY